MCNASRKEEGSGTYVEFRPSTNTWQPMGYWETTQMTLDQFKKTFRQDHEAPWCVIDLHLLPNPL